MTATFSKTVRKSLVALAAVALPTAVLSSTYAQESHLGNEAITAPEVPGASSPPPKKKVVEEKNIGFIPGEGMSEEVAQGYQDRTSDALSLIFAANARS